MLTFVGFFFKIIESDYVDVGYSALCKVDGSRFVDKLKTIPISGDYDGVETKSFCRATDDIVGFEPCFFINLYAESGQDFFDDGNVPYLCCASNMVATSHTW